MLGAFDMGHILMN